MNNGKVRIYELSRELDLDNKDILAICERLEIAVKSHSSTITESDAERIRAAAAGTPKRSLQKPTPKPKQKPTLTKPKAPNRPVRKQQILEVRRHQSPEPRPPERRAAQPQAPAHASSDSEQPSDNLRQPPNRPGGPSKPAIKPPQKPVPRPASRPAAAASGQKPADQDSSGESTPQLIQPKLVSPPSRSPAPRPKMVKRDRGDSEGKKIPVTEVSAGEVKAKPTLLKEKPSLKPKPVVEARRPKPNGSDSGQLDNGEGAEVEENTGPVLVGAPRRPDVRRPAAPARPPKRGKPRGESEEEEMRQRASKNATKKRRAQRLDDDDDIDELEAGLSGDSAATPISISLMRPPKPKSHQSQAKPATVKSRSMPSRGGSSRNNRRDRKVEVVEEKPELIVLTNGLTVHELAQEIREPETEVIKFLFFKGIATNINQTLDIPTAKMVAEAFEIEVETAEAESEAKKTTEMLDEGDLENLKQRPPVVTIMGHVDHGKTSLLDAIREAKVASGEAGGITQHIGAYHVDVDHDGDSRQVVFLDTPGHEAFTAMRARGTRVTDIAVLVVAADDGVRPQTIEAISHAKAAQVPIVTAINKVDKETANPDRVKQELMEQGLVPEEWGGDSIMVPVSALTGENLDLLLEMLLLQAEVEDLHANPDRLARGTVIEANLDKARGPVATLLIQNGTLKIGDSMVVGSVFGKVRAMLDDRLNRVEAASPSFAVEVLGLNDVPQAGDEFEVFESEKEARAVADNRAADQRQSRLQQAMASRRVTLNTLSAQAQEGELKELNILLKADVQGSVEAILASLQQLPQDEVQIRVLMAAPGEISETDVDLAAASGAVIIGFNTTLAPGAQQASDRLGVDIRDYDIIYKLLEDIEGAMEGLLEPELVEEALGEVEVRAVFPVRKGAVAGCYVLSGKVTRNCKIRVMRNGSQVYEGNLDSLKRMRDDVKEVASGFECGIGVDKFSNWQEGDRIEAFKMVTKRRTLAGRS
ncbi:translation initiation factor if-2 [Leptolyngbya sp. Heron Island J]|uniref:translation initiation factor IF-2 n=1 Tax=Leptolyngbya sp. Heron Island J TaxID=1385935 RepID=UPI0003B9B4DF|nr:translation initiation factor IF-2 [Leptolyngbya sp. Heron Island J]ESA37796.1 translation initiation factor if-2 [Leptolyngbya sp. Heron Island J]